MRRKTLKDAKLIVRVESDKNTKRINTISVFDNRTQLFMPDEFIKERGMNSSF